MKCLVIIALFVSFNCGTPAHISSFVSVNGVDVSHDEDIHNDNKISQAKSKHEDFSFNTSSASVKESSNTFQIGNFHKSKSSLTIEPNGNSNGAFVSIQNEVSD